MTLERGSPKHVAMISIAILCANECRMQLLSGSGTPVLMSNGAEMACGQQAWVTSWACSLALHSHGFDQKIETIHVAPFFLFFFNIKVAGLRGNLHDSAPRPDKNCFVEEVHALTWEIQHLTTQLVHSYTWLLCVWLRCHLKDRSVTPSAAEDIWAVGHSHKNITT